VYQGIKLFFTLECQNTPIGTIRFHAM